MLDWFDPSLIFRCGQVFHWEEAQGGWQGFSAGKPLRLFREGGAWRFDSDDPYWARYFDARRDYDALAAAQSSQAVRGAMLRFRGLRVLRQPPWEALVAFILSSNNHIPRIASLVKKLCAFYGQGRAFPSSEQLADQEETLRELGCGYRARYLRQAAAIALEGFPLDSLEKLPYSEAHALLKTLPGVGDKVADCVLLFGCGHSEAFPVDVWMERCLPRYGISGSRKAMADQARAAFGEDAGVVQQFLFHDIRSEREA